MPLYEYRCDACGHQFELIQRFSDPPVEVCPSCGERQVQKLLSSPAIQFKGSGWYITDYARKGGEKSGEKGGDKADKPAESTDAKSGSPEKTASSDASTSSESTGTASSKPSSSSPATSKE
jgi:putative FmdB family regulatory protein